MRKFDLILICDLFLETETSIWCLLQSKCQKTYIGKYTLQHTLWYFLLLPSVWILGWWCFFLFRIKMAENIQSLMHSGLKM